MTEAIHAFLEGKNYHEPRFAMNNEKSEALFL